MPKLSPTMEGGTLVKWRKKEGDEVRPGDVLFEVATDKATVEHNALDGGFLRKILIKEGQEALVNQPLAIMTEKKEESIEGYKPEGIQPTAAPVVQEKKKEEPAQPVTPAQSVQSGFAPAPPLEKYAFEAPTGAPPDRIAASPLARRLAKEKGIDLTTVRGSGPNERIMSRDLQKGQKAAVVTFGRREAPKEKPGAYVEEALTPMRKVIAKRLQDSKTFIPHFYVTQEVNAEALTNTRAQLLSAGLKFSINDFVLRACALALREHPHINSGFNAANSTLIRFKTVDIAVAVTLPGGLITPIVRHADFKNLGQISAEIKLLAERARQGKLQQEEYMGGSFTVSNLGMFGVTTFSAIINPPQAAILAVGTVEEKPVVKAGAIVPGKTLQMTLSVDHRVIDGVDAAKFIKAVQELLENPALLLV